MVKEYYIFDIKEGEDDVNGDIIIVRAGEVCNNMVSELSSSWEMFFFKNTPQIAQELVSIARANGGRWQVNFADFRDSRIEFEGKPKNVFYHKTLPKKKGFWQKLFGK